MDGYQFFYGCRFVWDISGYRKERMNSLQEFCTAAAASERKVVEIVKQFY